MKSDWRQTACKVKTCGKEIHVSRALPIFVNFSGGGARMTPSVFSYDSVEEGKDIKKTL